MGNQVSGNPSEPSFYGGVFAKLDNETFTPGDTLSGTVYLNLNNQYPGDKICLAVKGVEYVKWIDKVAHQRAKPDGTMETYYEDVPREASIDIIKQEMDVYDWQRGAIVPRGQYTFPFQFAVPVGLPGSFFFRRGTALAEIKYSVEAFLKPEKDNVPRLSHKVPVTVRENPSTQIQTKEVSITKSLTTWCCFNQGTCSMRTAFEKTAYAPNEEARIITEVDNSKCALGIPNVRFSLMQSIQLIAGPHRTGFSFVIRSTSLGRIEAGQACLGNDRKEASIILPPGQEGRAKDFTGTEGYEPDPSSVITPSTHGRLVKCDFNLQVVCETEGCLCCDSAPVNTLPILVYAPVIKRAADPTPPPNWKPQQMPAANLTITIINAPNQSIGITIPNNGNGMVGNQMPQQNFNQPNQASQMNQMSSPQPQFQQQQQPQFQQQQQPQFQQQQQPQFQQQQQQPQFQQQQQPQFQQQQQPQFQQQQQPQYQQQQQPQFQQQQQYQQQPQYQQQQQFQQQPQAIQPQMVQVGGYNQNQNINNYNDM